MPRPRKRRIFLEAPKLKWEFIRQKAEEFRRNYVKPIDLVPVPIIEIVELDFGIYPMPKTGLKRSIDIDGFLTRDLKNICVDLDVYKVSWIVIQKRIRKEKIRSPEIVR
jgi:hypothetical protein